MRIVFFGSASIAVETFNSLLESRNEIVAAFTQPDRPAGRGGHMHQTVVKERALEVGIPVEQPHTLKDGTAAAALQKYNPDVAVIVAYGHLIPRDLLSIPEHGFINLHASILPKYRGASPVPYAIMNGDTETGVTVFQLNEKFDEGRILGVERVGIEANDTSFTLLEKLSPIGAELVCKVVGELEAGWVVPVEQDEAEASRAPKMHKDDGRLDWSLDARTIDLHVRAYQPWPRCFTFYISGKKIRRLCILEVRKFELEAEEPMNKGQILHADEDNGLVVGCGNGEAIRLIRVKPEGKKEMRGIDFMHGARLSIGDYLLGID